MLAPVLSFTAEEFWQHLPGEREESVHLATFPDATEIADPLDADVRLKRLLTLREAVFASLEELRQAGAIGKSEEARVILGGDTKSLQEDLEVSGVELAPFLIVSRADEGEVGSGGIEVADYPGLRLSVTPYEAHTCSRCWRRVDDPVDDPELPDLCTRCHEVVRRLLEEGRTELGEAKA